MIIKSNLDCNYTFPIDLVPNRITFGAKSIGKMLLQTKFFYDLTRFEMEFSVCVTTGGF